MTTPRPEAVFVQNGVLSASYFTTGATIDISSTDATFTQPTVVYVGGAGDVKVDLFESGSGVIFKSVPAGTTLPVRVSKVYKVGTGATYLVGLY